MVRRQEKGELPDEIAEGAPVSAVHTQPYPSLFNSADLKPIKTGTEQGVSVTNGAPKPHIQRDLSAKTRPYTEQAGNRILFFDKTGACYSLFLFGSSLGPSRCKCEA